LRIVTALLVTACRRQLSLPQVKLSFYKTIGDIKLAMSIYRPPDWHAGEKRTAILFFSGGGLDWWVCGQEEPRAKHFAAQGMVAIYADQSPKGIP
jgi:hypothetical protein